MSRAKDAAALVLALLPTTPLERIEWYANGWLEDGTTATTLRITPAGAQYVDELIVAALLTKPRS